MRHLPRLVLICFALVAVRDAAAAPAADFNTHVAPLFQKYCAACHAGDEREGGLRLDSHAAVLQGGDRGAAILPGKSADSRLVRMLEGKLKPVMPPKDNAAPTAAEIALIKAWIDAGAKSPEGAAPDPTLLITPKIALTTAPRLAVSALAAAPDGRVLAVARQSEVTLVSPATLAPLRKIGPHRGPVTAVAFSSDGARLFAAAGEPGVFGEVRVWNVADGALVRAIQGHRDSLYAVAISADGKLLASGGYDKEIKLWDAATGQEVRALVGHNGAIMDLAFRRDGQVLASASADRTAKLWATADGARLDTFGQPLKELNAIVFSPDGGRVLAAGADNRIRVWRVGPAGKEGTNELLASRFAHEGAIIRLAWSADGRSVASAAEDRTVKIWNADTLTERFLLERQSDWPQALAFSADGARLFIGRADGSLAVYDTATGQVPPPPAKPELTSVDRRGVQSGATTRLRVAGKHLVNLTSAQANHAGLVLRVAPDGQDQAGFALLDAAPAADLPPGEFKFTVTTAGGVSNELALWIDNLPQVVEAEPNDQPAQATPAALPADLWGVLSAAGDSDGFAFDLSAGATIVCDVAGQRIRGKANTVLSLHDPSGRLVAGNNDYDDQPDAFLAYTAPAAGRYTLVVGDLAATGSAEHYYRVSVGAFPFVTGVFPLGLPAHAEGEVELTGHNIPAGTKHKLTVGPSGETPVALESARFRARRGFQVVAEATARVVESEPNDQPAQATPLPIPGVAHGRIFAAGGADSDLYRFEARAGQTWIIETDARRRGSPLDTRIEVLHADGRPVERLLLQAVRDSNIEFRGIDSSTRDVRLKNWEEMELNEWLYLDGEVTKLFRAPQGPDSGFVLYEAAGKRRCYFDTSATAHAVYDVCYIVEPRPAGAKLISTGLPVFPLHYANDDDGERRLGSDSRLTFTAPADGAYLIRVRDARGQGSDHHAYRLIVRAPRPDFAVSLSGANPAVNAGGGKGFSVSADRLDGYDGEIRVEIAGLPPGFSVSNPLVIQPGHIAAQGTIFAAADAPPPTADNAAGTKITATALVDGRSVVKEVNNLGKISLAPKAKLAVRLLSTDPSRPEELTIVPGTTVEAILRIERHGFNDKLNFTVDNLPHGVIVDNIGLNGVLLPAGQTERRIFITAARWTPPADRPCHAVAQAEGNQTSPPLLVHVRPAPSNASK